MEKNNWSFFIQNSWNYRMDYFRTDSNSDCNFYFIGPPPTTVLDFYSLFQKNSLIGLFNLDLLYLLTVLFMGYLYLAFFAALINTHKSIATIALALGLIGVAVYFVSNVSFEMMSLSNQYRLAETNEQKTILLTTGKVMLTRYHGTAFGVYYILNGLSLVLFSVAIIRNEVFSKKTAYIGLVAGILMLVPSTIGMVGMIFS